MIFKIDTPLLNCSHTAGTGGKEDYVYPVPGGAGTGNRMFMVCDVKGRQEIDEVACRAVYHAVCDAVSVGYDAAKSFLASIYADALHSASDVLDSIDGVEDMKRVRKGDVAIAFALLHKGGCFLATTGSAQVMLVRPGEGIIYRSRNVDERARLGEKQEHRLDAIIQNITNLKAGDYIYISNDKCGIMADDEIMEVLANDNLADNEKLGRLRLATVDGDVRREYLIHITDVQGDKETSTGELQEKRFKVGKVVRGPLVVAVVTALLALWFMLVFAISSYIIDRFDL